jgi:hypothetical protein
MNNPDSAAPIAKAHNKGCASKLPPGSMRLAHCDECGGHYYGSEAAHRQNFHGEPRPTEGCEKYAFRGSECPVIKHRGEYDRDTCYRECDYRRKNSSRPAVAAKGA